MTPTETPPGTWPLFTYRGIRVFLHWSWLLVAYYHISKGQGAYPHIGWDIAEYVVLFAIVLIHEFGHAFATRQVGGRAEQILLWPFGGIAYVQTPPRAGAYLWGVAAGPLVNVVLWPVFYFLVKIHADPFNFRATCPLTPEGWVQPWPYFLYSIYFINTALLVFNLLPAYPLDGGQIFRGLLWYKLGQTRSLVIAAWVGLILSGAALLYAAVVLQQIWLAIILGMIAYESWSTISRLRQYGRQPGGR
jgi:Zn-dependent protease